MLHRCWILLPVLPHTITGFIPLEISCHSAKKKVFYHPVQLGSDWPQSTNNDWKELLKKCPERSSCHANHKWRHAAMNNLCETWEGIVNRCGMYCCASLSLSLPFSPLLSSLSCAGEERSSAPLCIRSVERTTRDFTPLLRRNEMICPGAAAKCWMDTYSWDGYRSQL